jgi:predicted ATPase
LGSCYAAFGTKELLQARSKLSAAKKTEIEKLESDFRDRGIDIKKMLDEGAYSHQTYDHSEQAFLSYVKREGAAQIKDVVPDNIIVVISLRNPACNTCEQTLKGILQNDSYRKNLGLTPDF